MLTESLDWLRNHVSTSVHLQSISESQRSPQYDYSYAGKRCNQVQHQRRDPDPSVLVTFVTWDAVFIN